MPPFAASCRFRYPQKPSKPRLHSIVAMPPLLNQNSSLLQRVEDLPIQEPIPEISVEELAGAVLRGSPRLDEQGAHRLS